MNRHLALFVHALLKVIINYTTGTFVKLCSVSLFRWVLNVVHATIFSTLHNNTFEKAKSMQNSLFPQLFRLHWPPVLISWLTKEWHDKDKSLCLQKGMSLKQTVIDKSRWNLKRSSQDSDFEKVLRNRLRYTYLCGFQHLLRFVLGVIYKDVADLIRDK